MKVDADGKFGDYIRDDGLRDFIRSGVGKVLDVAGGAGSVSEWLQILGYDVSLIDNNTCSLIIAKERGIKNTYQVDVEKDKYPFPSKYFDIIFWGDNVEHLKDCMLALNEIYRVLKDNGRLIISTHNMGYWYYRYYYLKTGLFPGTETVIDNKKIWEWEHIRFFNAETLEAMLKEIGFKVTKVSGVNSKELKFQEFMCQYLPKLFSSILIVEAEKI